MTRLIKLYILLLIIICGCLHVHGQNIEKAIQLSLSTRHQKEDFNWSIAGNSNGQSPNVFSELKWKNVSGQDYSAALQWNVWRKIWFFGAYNRVNVRSGSVSDIDYAADNRTQPTYNQNFSDDKGSTSGWCAGAGYTVFNNGLFSLVPYVGYGINKQAYFIIDETGQFPDLNSDYNTQWKGPFIKVRSSLKIWRALKLAADVTYNQVKYNAEGNWNLINEFQHPVSYRHAANGYGVDAGLKLVYNITPNIGVNIGYNYFNWQTGNGNDQLYLATGQVDKTQLNGVYRKGNLFGGGVDLSL